MKKRTRIFRYGKMDRKLDQHAAYLVKVLPAGDAAIVAHKRHEQRLQKLSKPIRRRVRGTGIPAPRHGYRYRDGELVKR